MCVCVCVCVCESHTSCSTSEDDCVLMYELAYTSVCVCLIDHLQQARMILNYDEKGAILTQTRNNILINNNILEVSAPYVIM